ncbi:hypothetical protein ON010_g6359 [Phytophthora cinnamomi]|nr:hypothetical protein ON010_g6359 [Phytophthora cinnamomi]
MEVEVESMMYEMATTGGMGTTTVPTLNQVPSLALPRWRPLRTTTFARAPSTRLATATNDDDDYEVELAATTVEKHVGTEAEAISGIGTYVGSNMCLARIPSDGPRRWDCGVVVGYAWVAESAISTLHLIFNDGPESVPFDESPFEDLPVESCAMRSCVHRSEEAQIPLYDSLRGQVSRVYIKSVLKYVYNNSGRRRPPSNVAVGASLFTEPVSRAARVVGPVVQDADTAPQEPDTAPTRIVIDSQDARILDSDDDSDSLEISLPFLAT